MAEVIAMAPMWKSRGDVSRVCYFPVSRQWFDEMNAFKRDKKEEEDGNHK